MKQPKNSEELRYDSLAIEPKWQKFWEEHKIFSLDLDHAKKPWYNLMMFPYPSAEGMHVGNMYAFTGADVYGRFKRMQGYEVLEPIGLDGFGIHSENYALKIGAHPMEQADKAEKNFYRQMRATGNSYDWTRTVETYKPDYYHWTQWLFAQMFKAGLAYRKKAEVNWCPSCKTVLSDEQVIGGECERCGSTVEKRALEQWFFRITEYAEALLHNIEGLNWTEKVKHAQKEWIGKSTGALITFKIKDSPHHINVFTTRPDTLFGATFLVLSPEHELASKIESREVKGYIQEAKAKTEADRVAEGKEKNGVFSGIYAINPVNGEEIPIWIADFVLGGYGTGAVFADAHDERDFEFAKKYNLPLKPTLKTEDKELNKRIIELKECFTGDGILFNSGEFSGLTSEQARVKIVEWLEKKGAAKAETNYHLRDWLISRQRYWGAPIPMVYCSKCASEGKSWFTTKEAKSHHREISNDKSQISNKSIGNWKLEIENSQAMLGWYPVPEADLPVILPKIDDYKPLGTGKAPLASHPEFYSTKCPGCGADAVRETDVSDTFLDSAWYFFRYTSTDIQTEPFDTKRVSDWLPVHMYIGGAEHSVLHLLYSRFVTMVLKDLGYISFEEPYQRFFAHGLIIKDGAKMSKSKGNVVIPDEYIQKYGADTLRTYLMFLGPFSQGGDFRDSGIEGMSKFIKRVWRLVNDSAALKDSKQVSGISYLVLRDLDSKMHKTIKEVTEDIENLRYNTAIAHLMEYYNALSDHYTKYQILDTKYCKILILLLAPFAPHMTEELWHKLQFSENSQSVDLSTGEENTDKLESENRSIHVSKWPEFDKQYLVEDKVTVVIQVNGKRRGELKVESGNVKNEKQLRTLGEKEIGKYLEGQTVKKVVYVPGKIINFVV